MSKEEIKKQLEASKEKTKSPDIKKAVENKIKKLNKPVSK